MNDQPDKILTESEKQVLRCGVPLLPREEFRRVFGLGPSKEPRSSPSPGRGEEMRPLAPLDNVAQHSSFDLERGDAAETHERSADRIGETSAGMRRAIAAAAGNPQGLRAWAAENGAQVAAESINRLDEAADFRSQGEEHRVAGDPASGRVVKFTKDGRFGNQGIHLYLSSLERSNVLFDIGNVIEGIAEQADGSVSIVTSQRYFQGDKPTPEVIENWMAQKGYYRVGALTFYKPDTEEAINDAKPENIMQTRDGELHPFDVSFRTMTGTAAEMAENVARRSPYYPGSASPRALTGI